MPDHIKELLKEYRVEIERLDAERLEEIADMLINMAIPNIK